MGFDSKLGQKGNFDKLMNMESEELNNLMNNLMSGERVTEETAQIKEVTNIEEVKGDSTEFSKTTQD